MTMGETVMDTVSGAVTVVSGSGAGGRVPGEVRPRLRGCLSGRLFGCSLAGRDEGKSRRLACEPVAGFPVGRSAVSRCRSSRVAGGLTFPAGEASARAWV
jgi:hypothetical protein